MNCAESIIRYTKFPDLLPEIFAQIVDGIEEKRTYQSANGTIYITLVNGERKYAPVISHMGSLLQLYVSDDVRNFFKRVSLASYFNPVKGENERTLLKRVFAQIVTGKGLQEHPYNHSVNFKVTIEKKSKEGPLTFTIEKQEIKDAEKLEDESKDQELSDPSELLTQFLKTENLHHYFGI